MDVATLTAYRGLAVTEPVPFRGAIGYLTAEEHCALAMLRTGDLRLEQERLPADAIRQALMSVQGPWLGPAAGSEECPYGG